MSSQVLLDPVPLSILSIPRDKVWLFNSPILQLLHGEAKNVPEYSSDLEQELPYLDSDDEDSTYESDDSVNELDPMASSHFSSNSGIKRNSLSRVLSESKVDNSSKHDVASASSGSGTDLASLNKSSSHHDSEEEQDDHFFHIAFTPTECTVICSTHKFDVLFNEALKTAHQLEYNDVIVLDEPYLNLQVDSEGDFNNSARILELTRPLSEHKITLFFLSSHYTDIVLIPFRYKKQVMNILSNHKFQFSEVSRSYIAENMNLPEPTEEDNALRGFTAHDLESNTLKLFKEAGISSVINRKVKLLLTSARRGKTKRSILKAAQCIASNEVPTYFAITRISNTSVSLILPGSRRERARMGFDYKSIIGSSQETIIPITIDLTKLPLDSTGIVAGVASRLLTSMKSVPDVISSTFEMNYLSMARSAIILIPKENVKIVTKMLEQMKDGTSDSVVDKLSQFEI